MSWIEDQIDRLSKRITQAQALAEENRIRINTLEAQAENLRSSQHKLAQRLRDRDLTENMKLVIWGLRETDGDFDQVASWLRCTVSAIYATHRRIKNKGFVNYRDHNLDELIRGVGDYQLVKLQDIRTQNPNKFPFKKPQETPRQ